MDQIRRVVIITGGSINDYNVHAELWEQDDYIICADSGVNHANKLGVVPQLIVGDLDSALPENINFYQGLGSKVVEYEKEKDQTDTQIALKYALQKQPQEILILGAIGNRLDHTLANILLLTSFLKKGIKITIRDEIQEILLIEDRIVLEGKKGDLISLLPLTPWVKGIKTWGLKYAIKEGFFQQTNPYGVSNELAEDKAIIEVSEGLLLLIRVFV